MTGYFGTVTYADGSRVPLRAERCTSRPTNAKAGTHTCKQHRSHQATPTPHRCVCGLKWSSVGQVIT